jgi:hypothetical protein
MTDEEKKIENIKKKLVQRMVDHSRFIKNSKYGEFIIQTNEVQSFLILLILLKVVLPNKNLSEYLEKSTLGNLINSFRICASSLREASLINYLDLYNNSCNALAHKMYTKKELTEKDCELAIKLGEKILMELKSLLNFKNNFKKTV